MCVLDESGVTDGYGIGLLIFDFDWVNRDSGARIWRPEKMEKGAVRDNAQQTTRDVT